MLLLTLKRGKEGFGDYLEVQGDGSVLHQRIKSVGRGVLSWPNRERGGKNLPLQKNEE